MKITKEIKIALVATAGLVLLFFGMNFLKGLSLFADNNIYYMQFSDISGLSKSCPIYADGYPVGVVKKITYDYSGKRAIRVEADIDENLRIPKGSQAEIVSDMMGNVKVDLLLANNPRERVMPGETIMGTIQSGALGKMEGMIPVVEKMLPKLDSIMASLNMLLADPALAQSLHNVRDITANLTVSTRQLNTLLTGLNRDVPGVMHRADNVLDNATTLTDNLNKINLQGTMQKVDATLVNVQEFTHQLNNNQGTLGLLMRDPSLYNNLNATMCDADSLLVNLKAHPKRYVHFSIFGRKDK